MLEMDAKTMLKPKPKFIPKRKFGRCFDDTDSGYRTLALFPSLHISSIG